MSSKSKIEIETFISRDLNMMWINDAFCHFLWVLLKVDPSGLTPWTCFARSKKDAPLWEWYMRVASSPTPILFSSSPFASLEMYLWRKMRPDSSFQITLHSSSDRPYLIRVGGSFPIQKILWRIYPFSKCPQGERVHFQSKKILQIQSTID